MAHEALLGKASFMATSLTMQKCGWQYNSRNGERQLARVPCKEFGDWRRAEATGVTYSKSNRKGKLCICDETALLSQSGRWDVFLSPRDSDTGTNFIYGSISFLHWPAFRYVNLVYCRIQPHVTCFHRSNMKEFRTLDVVELTIMHLLRAMSDMLSWPILLAAR